MPAGGSRPISLKRRFQTDLEKKARKGFRGYPVATLAFYGPDDQRATKVAVGIILHEGEEPIALERWFSESIDVRLVIPIHKAIQKFIESHHAKTVVMADRIIGCPHEEVVDYPKGEVCPQCPFWAHRDRWTGEIIE